ncbi:hypothetical protein ABH931_007466 [Streptacidiphilus sp. MAP12-33]|uniref:hypothetical protein n=1 Tax=Streptacidiphilus sp. MAP12-33 TaxID=3156266 RepID=UPI0035176A82
MTRVGWEQVRAVLLADGWHAAQRDTFRVGPIHLTPPEGKGEPVAWPDAFAFDGTDGEKYAGPLTSVLAIDYATVEPTCCAHDELAQRLHGELVTVEDCVTVRFSHADRDFDVWLDATGHWCFVESGQRETAKSVMTSLPEADVDGLMSLMMGELKAVWGRGRPPDPRDGRDHDASPLS